MKKYCYYNGRIIELKRLQLNPYDTGFLRGFSVFEFLVTENGKPFLWREHFRRLRTSAREMNIKVTIKEKEYEKVLRKLIKKHNYKKVTLRTILTGGPSKNGFIPDGTPSLLILIEKAWTLPRSYYTHGITLATLDYRREFPLIKSSNYIQALRYDHLRQKAGALEVLYVYGGRVLESATSNFFLIKNEKLITPKDDVLPGITRMLTMKLAKKHYQIVQRPIREKELRGADEAFITSSSKNIIPVTKIDRKKVSSGTPGPVTQHLMKLYKGYVEKY